jgi:putative membrane protein
MTTTPRYLLALLAAVLLVMGWSAINPHDRFTWFLESFPVLIVLPLLFLTYTRFQFTTLVYTLIAIHVVILLIGGHYTYAEVPLFNWIRDNLGAARNNYDKVGHFAQGFIPAMVGRELVLRTSSLKPGKWLVTLIILSCLGISALYELLEWLVAEATGEAAEAFLGTQGDIWDTQKDMFLAGIGAVAALLVLTGIHDRQLRAVRRK